MSEDDDREDVGCALALMFMCVATITGCALIYFLF